MSYEPIGFWWTCDDALCEDCASREEWPGFESWEEPLAIFQDTERDSPTHCARCEALISHALTPDGYDYVAESIGGGGRRCIEKQWYMEYGKDLDLEQLADIVQRIVSEWPDTDGFTP